MIKSKFYTLIENLTESDVNTAAHLKETMFYFTTLMCAILGFFVLVPSLVAALFEGQIAVFAVDCFVYLFLVGFVFIKKISFRLRATVTCTLVYILGTVLLVFLGPASSGFIWLFSFSIFMGLFINLKYVNLALCMNIVTLIAIGLLEHFGFISWKLLPDYRLERWFATIANFILLNYISSVSMSLLLQGFENAFVKEKKIKKELSISEKRYRGVFENTGTGILIIEHDGVISKANARTEILGGFKREELEGIRKWTDFVIKEDKEKMKANFFDRLTTDPAGLLDYEIRIVTKENEIKTVALSMGRIDETNQVVVALSDITPRKIAETALRQSEGKYRTLIEAIPDGIAIINDETITFANKRMKALVGKKIVGESLDSIFTMAGSIEKFETCLKNLEVNRFCKPLALKMGLPGGVTIDTEITGALTSFEEESSIIIIVRDVTLQKQAELDKLYSEKLQGIIEMAGAVCHELNQPMMAVQGYGELLLKSNQVSGDNILPEAVSIKVQKIQEQIDRMGDITSKLMNITGYHTREYASGLKIIDLDKSTGASETH